jgi:DNA helicase II / ATP-dependent DNA helicase PcrA
LEAPISSSPLDFNPEQREAVEHLDGPLLVLAGAGAGKTRIVTGRIARLIESGVPPHKILAVTFTNKAAQEMRERVERTCNAKVLISTFHSLGARILRESYSSDFVIYDEEDSLKLIKTLAKEMDLKEKPKALRAEISDAKNRLVEPEEGIYRRYQGCLKEYNAVDFDDLLYLPVHLFKTQAHILEAYQRRWQYLLIDEYQDTNEAQYTMAKLLVEKHQNIFVVGDPDQSIYSWRGAEIGNILNFENDFPGAQVIRLEQNYRSTNTILDASNALIENNLGRYEKNLWSDLGSGDPITEVRLANDWEEAEYIADRIDAYHMDEGVPLNQIVVFYRTNAQSRPFEDALLRRRIPYQIVGGISFYHRREVKDIIAYLRMIESGADFLSFARTINLPKRGIGDATLEKLRLAAEGMPILDFCKDPQNIRLSAKQSESLKEYVDTIAHLRSLDVPLFELVSETIKQTGYLSHLKEDPESFQDRKANIDALIGKAAEWEGETLTAFLEELSLKSTLDEASDEGVLLMTVHNGKGLEFTVTFLAGMEEGLFPHINSKENLEEERRLCYVGMTRAKRHLTLTSACSRFVWGSKQFMRPSRFLREIPSQYKSRQGDLISF